MLLPTSTLSLRHLFRQLFLADDSGYINAAELSEACNALGLNMDREQLNKMIKVRITTCGQSLFCRFFVTKSVYKSTFSSPKEFDRDGNDMIDFSEFCQALRRISDRTCSWQYVINRCFEVFDVVSANDKMSNKTLCQMRT